MHHNFCISVFVGLCMRYPLACEAGSLVYRFANKLINLCLPINLCLLVINLRLLIKLVFANNFVFAK